jgi:thymidylate kinase
VLRGPWSVLSLANRLAEEWYRQLIASVYARRGFVVLFDRHYYADFHAYDIAGAGRPKPLKQRLHGWLLERFYPRPDLVILLDAPAEVLLARKGEGTLALLERRRQDYLRLREFVPRFVVVDATQPADAVLEDVVRRITEFHELQCRTHSPVQNGAA